MNDFIHGYYCQSIQDIGLNMNGITENVRVIKLQHVLTNFIKHHPLIEVVKLKLSSAP